MKGFKTTEEESNLDECNNYLNSDNNSEFRIHITERNKNILEETHKDNNKAENLSHIKDNAKNTIKERKYSKSQSENKSNSEHKSENVKKTNEDNKEETNKRETRERNDPSNIILWVIEIITIGFVLLLVANKIITPLTDFLVELFGVSENVIHIGFASLLGGGVIIPLHDFFKSLRK